MYMDDTCTIKAIIIVNNKERYYSFDFEGDQNNI